MEDLIELATYHDDQYGLVVQFLDKDNNSIFYLVEEVEGKRKLSEFDSETNRILEEKYFSMESDIDE